MAINEEQIQGNFKQLKASLKQQWSKLKDEDFQNATIEHIIGRIIELYGITKAEVEKTVEKLVADLNNKIGEQTESGREVVKEYVKSAEGWYECANQYLKDKPIVTLAIAAVIGTIIGSMCAR